MFGSITMNFQKDVQAKKDSIIFGRNRRKKGSREKERKQWMSGNVSTVNPSTASTRLEQEISKEGEGSLSYVRRNLAFDQSR